MLLPLIANRRRLPLQHHHCFDFISRFNATIIIAIVIIQSSFQYVCLGQRLISAQDGTYYYYPASSLRSAKDIFLADSRNNVVELPQAPNKGVNVVLDSRYVAVPQWSNSPQSEQHRRMILRRLGQPDERQIVSLGAQQYGGPINSGAGYTAPAGRKKLTTRDFEMLRHRPRPPTYGAYLQPPTVFHHPPSAPTVHHHQVAIQLHPPPSPTDILTLLNSIPPALKTAQSPSVVRTSELTSVLRNSKPDARLLVCDGVKHLIATPEEADITLCCGIQAYKTTQFDCNNGSIVVLGSNFPHYYKNRQPRSNPYDEEDKSISSTNWNFASSDESTLISFTDY